MKTLKKLITGIALATALSGCNNNENSRKSETVITGTPIATAYFDGYHHNREFVVVVKDSEGKKYTFFSNHENCGNRERNDDYHSPREIIIHAQTQAEIADGDNESVIVKGRPYNCSSNVFRLSSLNIEGEENSFK
jgi:hypothetical protein